MDTVSLSQRKGRWWNTTFTIEDGDRVRVDQEHGKTKTSGVFRLADLRPKSNRLDTPIEFAWTNAIVMQLIGWCLFAAGLRSFFDVETVGSDEDLGVTLILLSIAPVFLCINVFEYFKARRYSGEFYVFYEALSDAPCFSFFTNLPTELEAASFREQLESAIDELAVSNHVHFQNDHLETEIRKLAVLRESGVLTEDEFTQAKASLLQP